MRPVTFLKKQARQNGKTLQLDPQVLDRIAGLKLPFTSKNYYAFCDKYLDEDANEALFLDGDDTYFREIATDYDSFKYLQFLRQLYDKEPVLADIGCGIGNVVHYAGKLGFKSLGYELNPLLAPIHKKIGAEIVYGDILKTDLTGLKVADVVYLYRPMNDTHLMNKLFARIYEYTGKDVVILYNYPHSKNIKNYTTIYLANYDDLVLLVK
jgi:hypothetical protein